jgi:hypothetical protein
MIQGAEPVAEVALGASGITWVPRVDYGELQLTVCRPDGTVYCRTFKAGDTPSFDLSENDGKSFSDGSYSYELVVTPVFPKRDRDEQSLTGVVPPIREALTQTGYFTVKGGIIVTPKTSEQIARPLDEVIYDDLIVDGSLCVGNDCYSGLAFGFDTIVLMENNLRIYFDDTSNTSSFPNNDWRIVINDTTDGGGAYYAIQDVSGGLTPFTIEAGAKSNSLYVDDDGQVGIGTSGPVFELHIKEGDTPTVRLHQDTAYGWPEQIWDIGGNETSFFVRDGTHAARLPFRIEPETPSSTLCLKADGKVGIGTWSPSAQFEIETTGENAAVLFERTDGATGKFTARPSEVYIGSGSNHNVRIVANNNVIMTVEPGGDVGIGNTNPGYKLVVGTSGAYCDGGNWVDGSSLEYKENVRTLSGEEALATLEGLDPVKFNYKADKSEEWLGFIAEDVPELVATRDRKGMSPMDVAAVLTRVVQQQQETMLQQQKAVQEQQRVMQGQQKIIDELKNKILELEKKLK